MSTPTRHDSSKTLMGTTESSDRVVTNYADDPADFPAGTAVKNNAGALSKTTGSLVGVSLGASLSDTKKTAVCRVGNRVPLLLTDEGEFAELTVGDLTFTAKEKGEDGNSITITLADTADAGDETVEVDGLDIVVGIESTASTAQQIADALEASDDAMALIGVAIAMGEEASAQTAATEDNLEGGLDQYPYVVVGAPVEISATTGLGVSSGDATGATYCDEAKTGVNEDGSETGAALIDMGGGL